MLAIYLLSAHTLFVIEIAAASAVSALPPAAFFARWVDHSTWAAWSPDTEWVHLNGAVAQGTTGTLKPKGGPRTAFTISTLVPDREYTDSSRFPGATLVFQHVAEPSAEGSTLEVCVTLDGPLAWLWARILGRGFRTSVPADLERLVALVEASARASA